MIRTILTIHWLDLKRDRVALALMFILPVLFFSIFAVVFGRSGIGDGNGGMRITVIIVDEDDSPFTRRLIEAVRRENVFRFLEPEISATEHSATKPSWNEMEARESIHKGDATVAVVLPGGLGRSMAASSADTEARTVKIIYDSADPASRHIVSGILQHIAWSIAPDMLIRRGFQRLAALGISIDGVPWEEIDRFGSEYAKNGNGRSFSENKSGHKAADRILPSLTDIIPVEHIDVRGKQTDQISYYAAGVGVMFLLFSMAGAGGSLLEEQDSGTLERLLNSRLSMRFLLLSNWLFFIIVGICQLTVMFLWGAGVFGLSLWSVNHLAGFAAMTTSTAAAASAFGIVLATLCKTRAQLSGLSTVVILIMSALGGSMVPRFVMPDFMETASRFTLNGWAIDGYLKVFWYDDPGASLWESLSALWPEITVLAGMTAACMLIAALMARRWESI